VNEEAEQLRALAAALSANRDQQLALVLEWVEKGVRGTGDQRRSLEDFAELLSKYPPEDLRKLNDGWLRNVQVLAWLGLTDVLAAYHRKREDEEWA
jgi:hypothetical protein